MTFHIIMWSCKIYTNLWSYQCCEFTLFKWCIFIQNFSENRICIMRYLISYSLRTFTVLFNIFLRERFCALTELYKKLIQHNLLRNNTWYLQKAMKACKICQPSNLSFVITDLNWNILLQIHWPNCYFSIKALLSAILSVSW